MSVSRSTPITSTYRRCRRGPGRRPSRRRGRSRRRRPRCRRRRPGRCRARGRSPWRSPGSAAGGVTVATIDAVDLAGVDAGGSSALRAAATDIICTVSSAVGPAALLDAGALLDPLVAGVDRVDDLGVGHHPRGPVGAEAEDRGVRGAGGGGSMAPSGAALRVQPEQRLAGGDQVAVLDEPLDDLAAVRRGDLILSRRLATSPIAAPAARTSQRLAASARVEGALGGGDDHPPGRRGVDQEASPCLSQKARASSSWSGS